MTDENPKQLQRALIKENGEYVFIDHEIPSLYKEGDEFVAIRKWPTASQFNYMKRKALLIREKDMK